MKPSSTTTAPPKAASIVAGIIGLACIAGLFVASQNHSSKLDGTSFRTNPSADRIRTLKASEMGSLAPMASMPPATAPAQNRPPIASRI